MAEEETTLAWINNIDGRCLLLTNVNAPNSTVHDTRVPILYSMDKNSAFSSRAGSMARRRLGV
jgi:hypothetical protein